MPLRTAQPTLGWPLADTTQWALEKLDWLAVAALLALYAYGAGVILTGQPRDWVDLITDDGYYYLGVVRGIVEEGSSSFLPPFETNGYQPLWALLLSASAFVFGTSDRSLALQLYSLCYAFVAAFAWMSRRRFGFAFPAIASAAVFSGVTLEGMETVMMPVFILGLFYSKTWPARGIFASLIFLTRLDALALVVARDAYRLVFKRDWDFRHYGILVPVVLAYFGINYLGFGTPVPVSGLAKSLGQAAGENLGLVYLHLENLASTLLLLAAVLAFSAVTRRRVVLPFRDEILILLAALGVICGYYALRSGWLLWPWYYWPQMMLFFYAVLGGVRLLRENAASMPARAARTWLAATVMVALFVYALLPAAHFAVAVLHQGPIREGPRAESFGRKNVDLAQFVRSGGFPAGTFFAMGDRAGSFGFFLGRGHNFIQTEGLVGPYAYYDSMKKGEAERFLAAHGIDYLVAERDRFFEDGEIIGVVEPVQPLSSRFGQYLVCFRNSGIVLDQSYVRHGVQSKRYLFDFSTRTSCPQSMVHQFEALRQSYGQLRRFMLFSEYGPATGQRHRLLAHPLDASLP